MEKGDVRDGVRRGFGTARAWAARGARTCLELGLRVVSALVIW